MGVGFQSYDPASVASVQAFNQRLKDGGCAFKLPEHAESRWLPRGEDAELYEEFYLAKDGDSVRGGYVLKHQVFKTVGGLRSLGYLYSPLSEGVVNPAFGSVGVLLLRDALRRQPAMYCLGMGGFHNALPQLLKALGWRLCAVPFFFHVVRPRAFLQNIVYLRQTRARRLALDFLAASGLGHLGVTSANFFLQRQISPSTECHGGTRRRIRLVG